MLLKFGTNIGIKHPGEKLNLNFKLEQSQNSSALQCQQLNS